MPKNPRAGRHKNSSLTIRLAWRGNAFMLAESFKYAILAMLLRSVFIKEDVRHTFEWGAITAGISPASAPAKIENFRQP